MPSFIIHCKCMGGWFVLKSIAHGSKCPIELCLPIDAGGKFSWLMKTCSEFPLHLRDAANEVIQIAHVHMKTSGVQFVKTVNINFTDNLAPFLITKSLWSYLKLLLISLLGLGFGFDQSLPRGKPVGKSPYYRSFDRSANWRVKDSIEGCISFVLFKIFIYLFLFISSVSYNLATLYISNRLFWCEMVLTIWWYLVSVHTSRILPRDYTRKKQSPRDFGQNGG